jgi:hypothetical protein
MVGCLLVLTSACSEGSEEAARGAGADYGDGVPSGGTAGTFSGGNGANGTAGSGGAGTGDGIDALPPELELTVDLQQPQASENFVYTTNPAAGTVSVIYAETLSIRTLETGDRPTYLRTLPGTDDAIVLNVGSDTATVIRSTVAKTASSDLPVVSGANAIGVAPDGKHAVVYYNATYASAGNSSGSYQDVSVLALSKDGADDEAVSMTVGFRPRDVFFSADSTRAFVVTEDGVSILDFARIEKQGSNIAELRSFGSIDMQTADVSVTPDGKFALARAEGASLLRLVDLTTGSVKSLDVAAAYLAAVADDSDSDAGVPIDNLPAEVTDLDMLPNGNAAIAVVRNRNALLRLPIPQVFDDVTKASTRIVSGEVIGSVTVSPSSDKTALLYTTAANIERITIVDLDDATVPARTVKLRKAVQAVAFTPDGKAALITHTKLVGDPNQAGISDDERTDRAYGYSLLRLQGGNVVLHHTPAPVGPVAMLPDGTFAFLLFRADALGIKEVHRVSLTSFIAAPKILLESPPISIGIAPSAQRVFVNQEHPDGRMTFIDWLTPEQKKTVTGFELNSRIRD